MMLWDLQMSGIVFMEGIITFHDYPISLYNDAIFFVLLISIIQVSFIQNWNTSHSTHCYCFIGKHVVFHIISTVIQQVS